MTVWKKRGLLLSAPTVLVPTVLVPTVLVLLAVSQLFSACGAASQPVQQPLSSSSFSTAMSEPQEAPSDPVQQAPLQQSTDQEPLQGAAWLQNAYIQTVAEQTLDKLPLEHADDTEKVRLVYEYLVRSVTFADPVGLDCWRYRGKPDQPAPPFLENRALSPLAFGVGSCEDYAAAMTLLLRGMGFEARYLPGLTVSVKRDYTDHAWVMVRVGQSWYHLDPQLERNVMKSDTLTYRYFLKTDQQMQADHLWGDRWIRYGMAGHKPLTQEQIALIRAEHIPPACRMEHTAPPAKKLTLLPAPVLPELRARLEQEKQQYEQAHGLLPELVLNTLPPVFGADATPASGEPAG